MRAALYLVLTLLSGGILAPPALALLSGRPARRGVLAGLGLLPFLALALWKPYLWTAGVYLLAEGAALAWTAEAGIALAAGLLLAQVAAGVGVTLLFLGLLGKIALPLALAGGVGVGVAAGLVHSLLGGMEEAPAQEKSGG